jgi:TRAP-type uncharacterized transport system substrate-binding protein
MAGQACCRTTPGAASSRRDRRNGQSPAACGRQGRDRPTGTGKTNSPASPADRPSSRGPPDSSGNTESAAISRYNSRLFQRYRPKAVSDCLLCATLNASFGCQREELLRCIRFGRSAPLGAIMLGFNRWGLAKGLAAVLCIVGLSWLALDYFVPAPPTTFTIATGAKGQTYEALGKQYRDILARSHVDLELRLTNGAADNIKLLDDPTSGIKVGIAQGGISNSERSPDLLSLGRVNYQIYWIFHRAAEPLDDLRQLKGKRIAIGPLGSGQRATAKKILGISGVSAENSTLINLTTQGAETALNDDQIDALFLPIALDAPILQTLLKNPRLSPMSFTEAEAVTRIFPFLARLVLPRAVIDFEKIVPATDLILIATPNVVLVRNDIHPALIDLLAQAIVETSGKPGIFSASRRISNADRSGISRRSQRSRFLQKRLFVPQPLFAVLDDQLCAENYRGTGGRRGDRASGVQLCAQALSVVRARPNEQIISAAQDS